MKYRFQEKEGLAAVLGHIEGTYTKHYAGVSSEGVDLQTVDVFASIGKASAYCHTNALKYLLRYGIKYIIGSKGAWEDLLKAAHCIILLMHFDFPQGGPASESTEDPPISAEGTHMYHRLGPKQ